METYVIEADGAGGFKVLAVDDSKDLARVVEVFPTQARAREWVDAQTQIDMKNANASDVA